MRGFTRTIAGVGVLVAGMSLAAWAHDRGFVDSDGDGIGDFAGRAHVMKGRIDGPFGLNLKNVTLTTDQQTQVDKLTTDHQTAVTPLQTTLQAKETELRALMSATAPDRAAINAKIDELNSARSELQKEMTSYQLAVRGLLTAEQQAALPTQGVGFGPGPRGGHGPGGRGHGRR